MEFLTLFSDEQVRCAINLEQHYDAWVAARRALSAMPYGMRWVRRAEYEYLYEFQDRANNNRSLGPRSPETEERLARYQQDKEALKARIEGSRASLDATTRIYRALRMPLISSEGAKILREADVQGLLGTSLLVVGTNAIPAYSLEAGGRISVPDETDDFDMTWSNPVRNPSSPTIMAMLKAVDVTYAMNTERTFQARNAKAYEFELLAAPSTVDGMALNDQPRPIPLPEQEWLLLGRCVSRVVSARDGTPAKIVAPDPRMFALQKLWLSKQEKRDPLKRPKDAKQGMALLSVVAHAMPHYPLDEDFRSMLPRELLQCLHEWQQQASLSPQVPPQW